MREFDNECRSIWISARRYRISLSTPTRPTARHPLYTWHWDKVGQGWITRRVARRSRKPWGAARAWPRRSRGLPPTSPGFVLIYQVAGDGLEDHPHVDYRQFSQCGTLNRRADAIHNLARTLEGPALLGGLVTRSSRKNATEHSVISPPMSCCAMQPASASAEPLPECVGVGLDVVCQPEGVLRACTSFYCGACSPWPAATTMTLADSRDGSR
jgi:hypothetical protein